MNSFESRSLDIAQTSAYLAMYARKNQKIIGIEQFGYNTKIAGVAQGGGVGTSTVQILSDSDFVLTYFSGQLIASATGALNNSGATVQITDTGTGKTFFNEPTLFGLVFGAGGFPFLFAAPRLIAPNTNIKFDVTNIQTASGNLDFWMSMQGARIYYEGNG